MDTPTGVTCTFDIDGKLHVTRVTLKGRSTPVGQGRQWADDEGRHVLVQLPDQSTCELVLLRHTLTWVIRRTGGMRRHV